jgi:hypothetical protein
MLLEPVEETIAAIGGLLDLVVYKFHTRPLGKIPIDRFNTPISLREAMESYRKCYFNGKEKVLNPYFRYFKIPWFQYSGGWHLLNTLLEPADNMANEQEPSIYWSPTRNAQAYGISC